MSWWIAPLPTWGTVAAAAIAAAAASTGAAGAGAAAPRMLSEREKSVFSTGTSTNRDFYLGICHLESPRIRKAPRILLRGAHDRRLPFPPASGVSRHVAPAVRMLQMHPTSLSRARVSVRQPSQPTTAPLFESCSVRKRARFFAHDGAPRGAWCSGHRLARAEWLRRGSVHLVRPAFRPAPTHSRARASSAPF